MLKSISFRSLGAALGLAAAIAGARVASASAYYSHVGNADPTSEGWILSQNPARTSVGPVNDGGVSAWNINDFGASVGDAVGYKGALTMPQANDVEANGFTLSVTLRVIGAADQVDGSISCVVYTNSKHYGLAFGSNVNGDPIVREDGNQQSYTLTGAGSTYHTYSMEFNPAVGNNAKLYIDGIDSQIQVVPAAPDVAPYVYFGSGDSVNTGDANYSMVEFTSPVPEPASLSLLGIGAMALLSRRRSTLPTRH